MNPENPAAAREIFDELIFKNLRDHVKTEIRSLSLLLETLF